MPNSLNESIENLPPNARLYGVARAAAVRAMQKYYVMDPDSALSESPGGPNHTTLVEFYTDQVISLRLPSMGTNGAGLHFLSFTKGTREEVTDLAYDSDHRGVQIGLALYCSGKPFLTEGYDESLQNTYEVYIGKEGPPFIAQPVDLMGDWASAKRMPLDEVDCANLIMFIEQNTSSPTGVIGSVSEN